MIVPLGRVVGALAVAAVLMVVGCGDGPDSPIPAVPSSGVVEGTESAAVPGTGVQPSPASSLIETPSLPAPTPEREMATVPAPTPAAEPYVVECLEGTPGPARWSDGTTRFSQWCFDSRGGEQYLEEESQSGLESTGTPDPYGRGYTCDAAGSCRWPDGSPVIGADRCGQRCGEPPTSGDVQREWWDCVSTKSEEQCREELGR